MAFQPSQLSHRENRTFLHANYGDSDDPYGTGRSSSPYQQPYPGAHSGPPSRSTSPYPPPPSSSSYANSRTAEELESQNDETISLLSSKISALKNVTLGIQSEVRDSNKFLNGMGDDFGEAGGLLSGTVRRMERMARRQGGQFCFWMAFLGAVFLFFILVWLWRR